MSAGQVVNQPLTPWIAAFEQLSQDDRDALPASGSHVETLESLTSLALQRKEMDDSHKITVKIGDRQYGVRDTVEKIVRLLDKFKSAVDVAASVDPVYFGSAWAGLRILLQIAVDRADSTYALLVGIEKIFRYIGSSYIYEQLYLREPINTELSQRAVVALGKELQNLYASILGFLVKLIRHFTGEKTAAKRGWRYLKGVDVANILQICDVGAAHVETAVQSCQLTQAREINNISDQRVKSLAGLLGELKEPITQTEQRTLRLFEVVEAQRRSSILRWISMTPYEGNHKTAARDRTPDTCGWLLHHEDFENWRQPDEPAILWLYGSPGVGKTKLASAVIDHLLDDRARNPNAFALAYFYCQRDQNDRNMPDPVLQGLVRQLATPMASTQLPIIVSDLYERAEASGFPSGGLSFEDSQDLTTQLLRLYPQTYLVVDALDECDRESRLELVQALEKCIESSHKPVKLFISSRPDGDIEAYFRETKKIHITTTNNASDIGQYIKQRLQYPPTTWKNWFDETLKIGIRDALSAGGDGMFQWVSLQLDQIFRFNRKSDVEHRLRHLKIAPRGLKETYTEICKRISEQEGSASKIAERAFIWLMVRPRPSPKFLLAAVCQDSETENIEAPDFGLEFVLDACQNLIFEDTNGCMRFSHLSVQEYLERHWTSREKAHLLAAEVCLSKDLGPAIARDTSADGVRLFDHFGNYANFCWYHHVRNLGGSAENDRVMQQVDRMFGISTNDRSSYEKWVKGVHETRKTYFNTNMYWEIEHADGALHERSIYSSNGTPRLPIEVMVRLGMWNYLESRLLSRAISKEVLEPTNSILPLVARSRNPRLVKLFIENGASVNSLSDEYGSAFYNACETGNLDIVKLLLEYGADADQRGVGSDSPMNAALRSGDTKLVKYLLQIGEYEKGNPPSSIARKNFIILTERCMELDPFIETYTKAYLETWYTPLHGACSWGYKEIVELLLDYGADVNTICRGSTALTAACEHGRIEIVRKLLQYGADVNVMIGGFEGSALIVACSYGHETTIKLLLDHGANINGCNPRSELMETPLHAACFWRRTEIVKFLLDHGAKTHRMTNQSMTVLEVAATGEQEEIVKVLLEYGADVNEPANERNGQPLQLAAASGDYRMVSMLLDHGARREEEPAGAHGYALHAACTNNHVDIVQLLLNCGHNARALDRFGRTALNQLWSYWGLEKCFEYHTSDKIKIAQLLLEVDESLIDLADLGSKTPLYYAIREQDIEGVRFLLKRLPSIDYTTKTCETPLTQAVRKGTVEGVTLLLEAGADPNFSGVFSGPLTMAINDQRMDLVEILRKYDAKEDSELLTVPQNVEAEEQTEEEANVPRESGGTEQTKEKARDREDENRSWESRPWKEIAAEWQRRRRERRMQEKAQS